MPIIAAAGLGAVLSIGWLGVTAASATASTPSTPSTSATWDDNATRGSSATLNPPATPLSARVDPTSDTSTTVTIPGIGLGSGAPGAPIPTAPGAGSGTPSGGSGNPSPGFFDITGHIEAAIDAWFTDLVTSALNPVLDVLGQSLLATPDVTSQSRVGELWSATQAMADSLLVLFVIAGGGIVMGHETLQTRTAAKDIAPRLLVAAITANASLALVGLAINVSDSISGSVLSQGADSQSAATVLKQVVTATIASGGIFLTLLGGVVAVLGLVLLATFIVRLALTVILVVAAPLALICHALPQTESLAHLWWRALAGCLLTQIGQSLVLVTAIRVFLGSGGGSGLGLTSSSGLVDLLVCACLCWVLIAIPKWVGRMIFATNRRGSSAARMVRNIIIYRSIRALGAGA